MERERVAELISAAAYGTVLVLGALAPVGIWIVSARPSGAWMFALATVGIGVGVVGLTLRLGH